MRNDGKVLAVFARELFILHPRFGIIAEVIHFGYIVERKGQIHLAARRGLRNRGDGRVVCSRGEGAAHPCAEIVRIFDDRFARFVIAPAHIIGIPLFLLRQPQLPAGMEAVNGIPRLKGLVRFTVDDHLPHGIKVPGDVGVFPNGVTGHDEVVILVNQRIGIRRTGGHTAVDAVPRYKALTPCAHLTTAVLPFCDHLRKILGVYLVGIRLIQQSGQIRVCTAEARRQRHKKRNNKA